MRRFSVGKKSRAKWNSYESRLAILSSSWKRNNWLMACLFRRSSSLERTNKSSVRCCWMNSKRKYLLVYDHSRYVVLCSPFLFNQNWFCNNFNSTKACRKCFCLTSVTKFCEPFGVTFKWIVINLKSSRPKHAALFICSCAHANSKRNGRRARIYAAKLKFMKCNRNKYSLTIREEEKCSHMIMSTESIECYREWNQGLNKKKTSLQRKLKSEYFSSLHLSLASKEETRNFPCRKS